MKLQTVLVALLLVSSLSPAVARERIHIVGSPLVLSFTEAVAKRFALNQGYPVPSLETNSTGVGFGMFCAGVGYQYPDINGASRRMTRSEFAACQRNGVAEITEIPIGLDGIVIVSAAEKMPADFTRAQLFAALAREVEDDGKLVENPFTKWSDVDPTLPDKPIEVMGPPPNSAAQVGFLSTIMDAGCKSFPAIAALEEGLRFQVCRSLRTDGAFQEGAKNENLIVDWLGDRPFAFAIMSFSMLERHQEALTANAIEGVVPTSESISKGTYALLSPLYIYVKNRHVAAVPGLQELLYEFTSERAISMDGYLEEEGFVSQDEMGRNRARDLALSLTPLVPDPL